MVIKNKIPNISPTVLAMRSIIWFVVHSVFQRYVFDIYPLNSSRGKEWSWVFKFNSRQGPGASSETTAQEKWSKAGWWGTEPDREKLRKRSFSNLKLVQL